MMLCGAPTSEPRAWRDIRTKTELAWSITPRPSVVEKKSSSTPTSWRAPVGAWWAITSMRGPILPRLVAAD